MGMTSISISTPARASAARTLAAGAVVGVLDGAFATTLCGALNRACTAERVFQSIASGLLGRPAFSGGHAAAALGVVLHFGIATGWAAAYTVAYRRSEALARLTETRAGVTAAGAALGVVVWAVMSLVVVPLSNARSGPLLSWVTLAMIAGHVVVVGLPIALIVRDRRAGGSVGA